MARASDLDRDEVDKEQEIPFPSHRSKMKNLKEKVKMDLNQTESSL